MAERGKKRSGFSDKKETARRVGLAIKLEHRDTLTPLGLTDDDHPVIEKGLGLKGTSKKKRDRNKTPDELTPGVETDVFSPKFSAGKSEDKLDSSRKISPAISENVLQRMNDQYRRYIELEGENKLTREWERFGAKHADEIAEARRLKRMGENTTPLLRSLGRERR